MKNRSNLDQEFGLTGNTVLKPNTEEVASDITKKGNKQSKQYPRWTFTFNNYLDQELIDLESWLKNNCKSYNFEKEIGKSGTKHLQGRIHLKTRRRLTELKKINSKIHWSEESNEKASINYCMKDAEKFEDIHSNLTWEEYPEKMKHLAYMKVCLRREAFKQEWERMLNDDNYPFMRYQLFEDDDDEIPQWKYERNYLAICLSNIIDKNDDGSDYWWAARMSMRIVGDKHPDERLFDDEI